MPTWLCSGCLKQAFCAKQPEREGALVNHSDRGSQYVSIRYKARLAEAGIEPSVGNKADSYGNALAETINELYEAEVIHRRLAYQEICGTGYAEMGVLVYPPPVARTDRRNPGCRS